jgi:hypothetical protein
MLFLQSRKNHELAKIGTVYMKGVLNILNDIRLKLLK